MTRSSSDPERPFQDGDLPTDQVRLRMIGTLAEAAEGAEPQAAPTELCRACIRLLPAGGASVSISAGPGVRPTWCASDKTAARLAEAQYTLGVQAVFSLPLGIGRPAVGTFDLYRDRAGTLADRDLRIALWVSDAVTFTLLNRHAANEYQQAGKENVASWIEAAEADHTEVYQAVGMVMVQLPVDSVQALDRMRARAFVQGRTISDVAQDVTARKMRFRPEPDSQYDTTDQRPGGHDRGQDDEPATPRWKPVRGAEAVPQGWHVRGRSRAVLPSCVPAGAPWFRTQRQRARETRAGPLPLVRGGTPGRFGARHVRLVAVSHGDTRSTSRVPRSAVSCSAGLLPAGDRRGAAGGRYCSVMWGRACRARGVEVRAPWRPACGQARPPSTQGSASRA
ncbi:ANTAR domain-containing protein [Streptomyces sp. 1222.5]|uniref:ANTAR domain-containing protein n=1 Tax=Streptomyces sp. 1222.5 TaxID=1881026 RepID=UPI003EBA4AD8